MQWLAHICVKRPIFATVLVLVICVVGLFGYTKLGVDRFPKIDLPIVVIMTVLPGAAPEDVETEISDKIEEAVNTIGGIDELRSISSEGVSQVVVTFTLEKNIDVASQEVRDRLNGILPNLPKNIEQPVVNKVDPLMASRIVWLDCILTNVDRTARNTNMLVWNKELWLIDHGASLYFHHSWDNWKEQAGRPFVQIKDHVLLPVASMLEEVDTAFHTFLTPEKIRSIVHLIPDEWLTKWSMDISPRDIKEVYAQFLTIRLAASSTIIKAAQHARQSLV